MPQHRHRGSFRAAPSQPRAANWELQSWQTLERQNAPSSAGRRSP